MSFKVSLVGRPNVGKSTFFNRLTKTKKSIVHDLPGVTRDRNYGKAFIGPLEFDVIDTPGLEEAENDTIQYRMMQQTEAAVNESDLVLLVVDGRAGITPDDIFFANWLRVRSKNVKLVVNKCERKFYLDKEYYKLGFGDPYPISAEHGDGIIDLYELIDSFMSQKNEQEVEVDHDFMRITVVGRPNTGKSTFINALLGNDRLLTGPEAGITRDSIEINWSYKQQDIKLVDTAGMRKKANISKSLEKMSVASSLRSIRFSNTVILMLDASLSLEMQDLSIANLVIEEGRAMVVAVNKSDLITDKVAFEDELNYKLEKQLSQIRGVPVVYLSALNKENIFSVIDKCFDVYKSWNRRISTGRLNSWLAECLNKHPLPLQKNGRRVRIKYATQIKTRPPTFKFFCNRPDDIPDTYQKYLLNDLRITFDLFGIAIRISFVGSENPYK